MAWQLSCWARLSSEPFLQRVQPRGWRTWRRAQVALRAFLQPVLQQAFQQPARLVLLLQTRTALAEQPRRPLPLQAEPVLAKGARLAWQPWSRTSPLRRPSGLQAARSVPAVAQPAVRWDLHFFSYRLL